MLKVGLIGCGGIGAVHASCWLAMDNLVQPQPTLVLMRSAHRNLQKNVMQKYM